MERTPVAVLGTLAEFHREPIPYDLNALVRLVTDLHPDLLCLDMTRDQWQHGDFADLPLAYQTDIVVVPIGGLAPAAEPTAQGLAQWTIAGFRRLLSYLQRTSPGPAAINQGLRHHVANFLYSTITWLAGREAVRQRKVHTDRLIQQVLDVVHRDPGRRILVVVNVRYCHVIRPALMKHPEVRVVSYAEL